MPENSGTRPYGATMDTLVADAITLRNGGSLYITENGTSDSPIGTGINRGITLKNGGNIYRRASSAAIHWGMPITGTGDLTYSVKENGTGSLYLYGGVSGSVNVKLNTTTNNKNEYHSLYLASEVSDSASVTLASAGKLNFNTGFSWTSTGKIVLPELEIQGPFIWQTTTQSASSANGYNTTEIWSDNAVPVEGKTYVTLAKTVRTPYQDAGNTEATFPNSKMIVLGNSSSSKGLFAINTEEFTINDLVIGPWGQLYFGGYSSTTHNDYQTLNGSVSIASSSTYPAEIKFASTKNKNKTINASISGSGALGFTFDNSAYTVNLYGDFSEYNGTMSFTPGSNGATLNIASAKAFGGNPETLETQGFSIGANTKLAITDNCNVSQANRGFYVAGNCTNDVANAKTFTWAGPLSFADGKTLTKTGDGDLIFNGDNSGALGTFEVSGGRVFLKGLTTAPTLADGTYAKRTANGIWLSNTAPTESGITIQIAANDSRTIDLDSSDALYTWLAGNSKTTVDEMNTYLTVDGTGGMNGFEAYMLGYENSDAKPKLEAEISGDTVTFSFDATENSRSLEGISVSYSVQSSNDPSFPDSGDNAATTTDGASLSLSADTTKTYNRLVATITAVD